MKDKVLSILVWNLQHRTDDDASGSVHRALWIEEHSPSVAVLPDPPEVNPSSSRLLQSFRYLSYCRDAWIPYSKKRPGLAVLAGPDMEVVATDEALRDETGRAPKRGRFVHVKVDWSGELNIMAIYVPPIEKKPSLDERIESKKSFLTAFLRYLAEHGLQEERTVVCGDLNMIASRQYDIECRSPYTSLQEKQYPVDPCGFMRRLTDWGFVDSWRASHPTETVFSHYTKTFSVRLDYIFLSNKLATSVTFVPGADPTVMGPKREHGLSDHTPIWLTMKDK